MIEPTEGMREAFRAVDSDCYCDDCLDERLAAVIEVIQQTHRITFKAGAARPRRVALVAHDPAAIIWARERAGWRQSVLARELGISRSALCEAEKGTRGLHPKVLNRMAAVFGCPVASLLRADGGVRTALNPHGATRPGPDRVPSRTACPYCVTSLEQLCPDHPAGAP